MPQTGHSGGCFPGVGGEADTVRARAKKGLFRAWTGRSALQRLFPSLLPCKLGTSCLAGFYSAAKAIMQRPVAQLSLADHPETSRSNHNRAQPDKRN